MIKKIDHLVITVEDIDKTISFYSALGFKIIDAGGRHELYAGDFKINVHYKGKELEPKAKNIQTGSADLCFESDLNIENIQNMLIKKEIALESRIVARNGVRGTMHSIYLRDPDGNLIEISSYK